AARWRSPRGRARVAGRPCPRRRPPARQRRARRPPALTVRLLFAALYLLQHSPPAPPARGERPDVRAGLDTLYGGGFPAAAAYFAGLAGRDSTDPAPLTFEASAYIWWAAALENDPSGAGRRGPVRDPATRRARRAAP